MPHMNICISKPVDKQTKNTLQTEIGNIMSTIPGKNISNTLFCICDCCVMYKDGQQLEGVFTDVRLFKNSPDESKKEFSMKLFEIYEKVLGIPPSNVQINFIEMPNWASNGSYK